MTEQNSRKARTLRQGSALQVLRKVFCRVHISNFSGEELVLPKSMEKEIAEEILEIFVDCMNEDINFELQQDSEDRKKDRKRKSTVKFKMFAKEIITLNS
jgi:hypothetical protein